ncbi:MAG TPA: S1C family serine protease [Mobilitalea sp.]|nr:S1C family serine protease [Mobilitalea sp.]
MSEKDKDNKENSEFEFIKEQVIEKKRKKIKKRLLPLLMTLLLAILFGLIAALTFVITEPRLYKLLHKEEDTKTPVTFPTQYPSGTDTNVTTGTGTEGTDISPTPSPSEDTQVDQTTPNPVIQKIDANLEDYLKMNNLIDEVAYEANKSQVYITSTFSVLDLFGNAVEKTVNTSGVIVANNNSDFLILASLDCVKDAKSIKIKFSEETYVDAVLQDYESELNLALLAVSVDDIPKIYLNGLQVAELGESLTVTVGTPVIALGNPNGHIGSMDIGIVTSKGSWANVTDNRIELFNTDMASNAYSDGIIVNMDGQVIGLITRTLKDDVNKELSTVIGISELLPIIEQMSNQQPRAYFGIKADDMTEAAKKEHDITNGIYVNEVLSDSPAFTAGLKNGDIILSIGEQTILNTNNFYNTISRFPSGQKVSVKIKRTSGSSEKEMELTVTLTDKVQ